MGRESLSRPSLFGKDLPFAVKGLNPDSRAEILLSRLGLDAFLSDESPRFFEDFLDVFPFSENGRLVVGPEVERNRLLRGMVITR